MKTSDVMWQRIQEFSRQLQEEFGTVATGEHSRQLGAAEEWKAQLGTSWPER